MYQRPDAANGDSYDPSFRVSVTDYEPKPNHCTPHYPTGHHTPDIYNPVAFYVAYREHLTHCNKCAPIVNTTAYQSKLHPYLYGLPRYGQGQAWG